MLDAGTMARLEPVLSLSGNGLNLVDRSGHTRSSLSPPSCS